MNMNFNNVNIQPIRIEDIELMRKWRNNENDKGVFFNNKYITKEEQENWYEKYKNNINIISSMGTGNKIDPTQFRVSDVFKTKVCPLAKVMRYELRKRGVKKLKVVYSEEMPMTPDKGRAVPSQKRQTPGSISFVPPVAGMK